jgi:hypothetical protein
MPESLGERVFAGRDEICRKESALSENERGFLRDQRLAGSRTSWEESKWSGANVFATSIELHGAATPGHPGKSRRGVDGVVVRRLPSAVADAAGILRAFG